MNPMLLLVSCGLAALLFFRPRNAKGVALMAFVGVLTAAGIFILARSPITTYPIETGEYLKCTPAEGHKLTCEIHRSTP